MPEIPIDWGSQGAPQGAQVSSPVGGSAIPVSASSSGTVLDMLGAQVRAQQENVQAAAQRLNATPQTVSAHTGSASMPVPSMKSHMFDGASVNNLDHIKPQTVARARSKAIGQLAGMAGNLVGNYMKKKEAEKTQALQMDLSRTLDLTHSIDQAQQILQNDPNNVAAKAQLAKSQAQLGNMLNDPKKAKAIAKAFDVSFGDEAKAKANTPESQAMTGAMRAKVLMDQLPQIQEQNPQYQAAQAQYAAQVKDAQIATKVYATTYEKVLAEQGKNDRNVNDNNTKLTDTAMQTQQRDLANRRTVAGAITREGMADASRLAVAREHTKAVVQGAKEAKTEVARMNNARAGYTSIEQENTSLQSQLEKLMADKKKKPMDKNGRSEDTQLENQIELTQKQIRYNIEQQEELKPLMLDDPSAAPFQGLLSEYGLNAESPYQKDDE